LIDGDGNAIARAQRFYKYCPSTRVFPPSLSRAFVTAENINYILSEHGFTGEIDLLSTELDGMD
jgi:hypothetical protein